MEFVLLLPQKAAALFLGRSPWHKQCWKVNSYWAEKKPPFWGGHVPKQINSGSQLQHHVPTCRAVGICNTPLLGLVWYPLVPHSSWGKTGSSLQYSSKWAVLLNMHFSAFLTFLTELYIIAPSLGTLSHEGWAFPGGLTLPVLSLHLIFTHRLNRGAKSKCGLRLY